MDKQTKIFEILEERSKQDKSLGVSIGAGYTEEEIPAPALALRSSSTFTIR